MVLRTLERYGRTQSGRTQADGDAERHRGLERAERVMDREGAGWPRGLGWPEGREPPEGSGFPVRGEGWVGQSHCRVEGSDEGGRVREKGWLWGKEGGDRARPRMRTWVRCGI